VEDIVGRWTINGKNQTEWVDGLLILAMKKGMWFLADEINAAGAEINFLYHSLLDDDGKIILAEKGDEVVIPHPNFRFFGAMNPPTEYAGAKELNKALLSRFMVAKVDFPPPKVEQKILTTRTKVTDDVAERLVRFAGEVRTMHGKGEINFVLSTRDLLMWATMHKVYKKYSISSEMTVLNKIGEDDIEAIKTMMALHFKAQDDIKNSAAESNDDED
jgi:cobaltochelatase CobS